MLKFIHSFRVYKINKTTATSNLAGNTEFVCIVLGGWKTKVHVMFKLVWDAPESLSS